MILVEQIYDFVLNLVNELIGAMDHKIVVIYAAVNGFCDRMPLERISQYEKTILSTINPELLKSVFLLIGKGVVNAYLPGSAMVVGFVFTIFSSTAMAAGPSDCWTGHPDERLLRTTENQILGVRDGVDNLALQAVERAKSFPLHLPGTEEEQTDKIRSILEFNLDGIALNHRIKQIHRWRQPAQMEDEESPFWMMIIDQVSQFP